MKQQEQPAPQQAEDDDPVIARSRDARKIMDLKRAEQRDEQQ